MSTSEKPTRTYDSGRQRVATVYAKGLIGAADKQGLTHIVMEELNSLIDDVLEVLPKFRAALAYPRISGGRKAADAGPGICGQDEPDVAEFPESCGAARTIGLHCTKSAKPRSPCTTRCRGK